MWLVVVRRCEDSRFPSANMACAVPTLSLARCRHELPVHISRSKDLAIATHWPTPPVFLHSTFQTPASRSSNSTSYSRFRKSMNPSADCSMQEVDLLEPLKPWTRCAPNTNSTSPKKAGRDALPRVMVERSLCARAQILARFSANQQWRERKSPGTTMWRAAASIPLEFEVVQDQRTQFRGINSSETKLTSIEVRFATILPEIRTAKRSAPGQITAHPEWRCGPDDRSHFRYSALESGGGFDRPRMERFRFVIRDCHLVYLCIATSELEPHMASSNNCDVAWRPGEEDGRRLPLLLCGGHGNRHGMRNANSSQAVGWCFPLGFR